MFQMIKTAAVKFHQSFRDSATILFARLQLLLAALWSVAIATDLTPVIQNPKYITAWLIFSGVVTEYCRRRPATLDPLPPVPRYGPTDGPNK